MSTVGDTTAGSTIWVPGEPTGKDIYGRSHALPVDNVTTSVAAGITVSGGVPASAPVEGELPLRFDLSTRVLYAWTGTIWVTVSGGL